MRLANIGEIEGGMVLLVLPDREKASDEVTRDGLFAAIARMNVRNNGYDRYTISLRFKVEVDGKTSEWSARNSEQKSNKDAHCHHTHS